MVVLTGIAGLILGSFLNCLIWRLNDPRAPRFWQGRSLCPWCRHPLAWKDNIPLLSYLFLRGKCRFCQKSISRQYPIVELLTALAFILIGPQPLILALACIFIVIFFSDLIYGLIPDEMIVLGVIISFLSNLSDLSHLIAGFLTAGFFLGVFLVTRKQGLGFGDVKLGFLMGLVLGWPKILVALWSGFILGGMVAVILLALRRTKLSATIALGPFLVIGVLVSALWTKDFLKALGIP